MRRVLPLSLAIAAVLALAPAAHAATVGSDLEALAPTKTVVCPRGDACIVAQSLGGNGTPFSPPTGVVTRWSVRFGAWAPAGIRLVIQKAGGTGGAGQGRRTIDVGSLRGFLVPNGIASFAERLPIQADETFGVRLEGMNRGGTAATIAAPFEDEYKTMLLWDPPPPFGGPSPLPTKVFQRTRIALSAEVVPPGTGRCDPLNTYTGSSHADDYGGFAAGGDRIYGYGGGDALRGHRGDDCVYGGRGEDRIAGMDGRDLLVGGSGSDDVGAGEGDDRILVRDGKRDTVRCGGGRDSVKADRLDRLSECEQIRRG